MAHNPVSIYRQTSPATNPSSILLISQSPDCDNTTPKQIFQKSGSNSWAIDLCRMVSSMVLESV